VTRTTLRSWGSVITAACDFAIRLGCRPLLFTGLDLAYTGDQPYARGTSFERGWAQFAAWGGSLPAHWARVLQQAQLVAERDVHGAEAPTSPHGR
jgi:hypothetical protein